MQQQPVLGTWGWFASGMLVPHAQLPAPHVPGRAAQLPSGWGHWSQLQQQRVLETSSECGVGVSLHENELAPQAPVPGGQAGSGGRHGK